MALLVLTLAPRRSDAPVAVSSTSSPGSDSSSQLAATASLGGGITGLALHPIATPIGNDGMALTTSRSIVRLADLDSDLIDVELVTGRVARAVVVDPGVSGGIAWVSLDAGAPTAASTSPSTCPAPLTS